MMRMKRQDTNGPTGTASRRRTRMKAVAWALGVGVVLAACADDGATGDSAEMGGPAAAGSAVVATTDDASHGTILTDDAGMTLYLFTSDSPGVSTCFEGCLTVWPPLLTDGEPVAQGAADTALLGTLTRDDGTLQVTYGGWPLYFYAADMAAGDTNGQGVSDVWFVVAPDGSAVTDNAAGGTAEDGMGGSGGSPASDGAYSYDY